MFKKILRITGIVLLVLVVLLLTLPFLFKGRIISLVKSEINKSLNATANFDDVDISFFRRFPRVSVQIENLTIAGKDQFTGDTLLQADKIDASVHLWSIVKGDNMKVYAVNFYEPVIHAIVTKDGLANWDIVKPDTATATGATKPFQLELQRYSINDGFIAYADSSTAMEATVYGFDHEGSGDFTADLFTLKTKTAADSVNFTYGTIPYLVNAKTNIDADIQVDNRTSTYTFSNASLLVNELKIATNGFFRLLSDSAYEMDITFNAPSTDFKNILSLVPAVYSKDFNQIKTSGQAVFNGFVKGAYTPTSLPAYQLNLDIANGSFKYPDLPRPLEDIQLKIKVDNADGVPDNTIINIPQGHFAIDGEPFDFRLLVKNPITDLFLDGAAKGGLDLSKVSQFVKLDPGTKLQGLLAADISVKGKVSSIEKQQYEQFNAAGFLGASNFLYASADYPAGIRIHTTALNFNPKDITLSECNGSYMNTNFAANGVLNNLLSFVLRGSPLTGALNVKADKLNLNDWMGTSADTTATTSSKPFQVPDNIRMSVNAQVNEVIYDQLNLQQLSGVMELHDETVRLDNIKANALDGTMLVSGSYSTKEHDKKPAITLKYDVKGFDVQKTFFAFNTVQKLMPVGQYLGGKLNSQLSMSGRLGDNMMPDLGSLSGNGSLLLIEGLLEKFKPLEKLGEILQVDRLKTLYLREVKQFFEFAEGKVFIKPFDVRVKDIDMEIGGMHGFDQSLDYIINLKLPRSLMGNKGNELVNNLFQKAANRGVPLKLSETVNLNVRMTGTLRNPDIKVELKEMAGSLAEDIKNQAKEIVKAKIDSTKQAVKDTLASVKKQVIKETENKLKEKLFGKDSSVVRDTSAKSPTKRAESATKDIIEGLFKKKKKSTDTIPKGQ